MNAEWEFFKRVKKNSFAKKVVYVVPKKKKKLLG